jgi:hypothetical protein
MDEGGLCPDASEILEDKFRKHPSFEYNAINSPEDLPLTTKGGMREDEVRTHPNECIQTSSSHTGSDDEFEKTLQLDEVPEPSYIISDALDLVSEESETDINKSVPYLENIYLQDKREPSCKLSEKTSQYYKNKSKK